MHSCKAVIYFVRKNICSKSDTTFYKVFLIKSGGMKYLHHSLEMDEGSTEFLEILFLYPISSLLRHWQFSAKAVSPDLSLSQSSRISGTFCKLCKIAMGKPRQESSLIVSVMPTSDQIKELSDSYYFKLPREWFGCLSQSIQDHFRHPRQYE